MECSNGAVKTAFHIQVEGKRGPGGPKDMEAAVREGLQSGSSWLSTLMIEVCGDLV